MVSKSFDEFKDEILVELQKEYSKRIIDKYILPGLKSVSHIMLKGVVKEAEKIVRRKRISKVSS